MRSSLAHLADITNFDELRDAYQELKDIKMREKRKRPVPQVVEAEQNIDRISALHEVACHLAKIAKVDLEQLLQDQIGLNQALAAELAEQERSSNVVVAQI